MEYIYSLDFVTDVCGKELGAILSLAGYGILLMKYAVPIILIVIGMIDLAKATTQKDEAKIKETQTALIKKAVAGVAVFLVALVISLLMKIIGSNDWKNCVNQTGCIDHPSSGTCVQIRKSLWIRE